MKCFTGKTFTLLKQMLHWPKRLREQKNKLSVELDADIAKYFKNSREVNLFIRKQIELVQKLVT